MDSHANSLFISLSGCSTDASVTSSMQLGMPNKTSQSSPAGPLPIYTFFAPVMSSWLYVNFLSFPPYLLSTFVTALRWQTPWSRNLPSWMLGKCLAYSGDYYKFVTVTLDLTLSTYSNHMGCNIQTWLAEAISQLHSQRVRRGRGWRGRK